MPSYLTGVRTPRNVLYMETTTARQCHTCGEFEGTSWVTAKCEFEAEQPAREYVSVVQEQPHGFYGGTRRANAKRATEICRHAHETKKAAEACADKLTAHRNAR